jgi:hypothetical protein
MKYFKRTLLMNELGLANAISISGGCKADGG